MTIYLSPVALRKARIVYNFGLSECNRVKFHWHESYHNWWALDLLTLLVCSAYTLSCLSEAVIKVLLKRAMSYVFKTELRIREGIEVNSGDNISQQKGKKGSNEGSQYMF